MKVLGPRGGEGDTRRTTTVAASAGLGDWSGAGVHVEVGLVMTERTWLRGGSEPAMLTDREGRAFGAVPAFLARRLVREAERAWLTPPERGAGQRGAGGDGRAPALSRADFAGCSSGGGVA